MLTGRYEHNNRIAPAKQDTGCMWQNSSRSENPEFWEYSVVKQLHNKGYTTGLFGKVLNNMQSYGCDGTSGIPPGVDRQLVMCTHTFFNCSWVNNTKLFKTGGRPEDYTTSVMGNASIAWIKSVLELGKTHPPFYAWIGPHAPHLPSTPAPWYADHPIGLLKAPIDVRYNYSAVDHHPLVAQQVPFTTEDAASIDNEYSLRMRSLLSVDDLVVDLHKLLTSYNEWDNTYVVFSSDHGYSLGQYRLMSHKMQVYENNLRVPFLMRGPGIAPGTEVDALSQFADLAPTLLTAAGVSKLPARIDGRSFLHFLDHSIPTPVRKWRDIHLTEFQSISERHCVNTPTFNASCPLHVESDATNTHRSIRIRNVTHNLLYAEFTDVSVPAWWDWSVVGFYEMYDLDADPYQLTNIYQRQTKAVKIEMATKLTEFFRCQGEKCP